jgi:hypothetical protein
MRHEEGNPSLGRKGKSETPELSSTNTAKDKAATAE